MSTVSTSGKKHLKSSNEINHFALKVNERTGQLILNKQ
jgi:hypothetical protein